MKSSPEDLANSTIEKICNSVKSGSVIFLEIGKWDDLPCQETTLTWFINNFWLPLVRCIEDKKRYPLVKFVAIIVVDSELSADCFDRGCLCDCNDESLFRWLNLPLRNWTQDEILEWLETYPGIDCSFSNTLSQRIFRASMNGIPAMVCMALEKELIIERDN